MRTKAAIRQRSTFVIALLGSVWLTVLSGCGDAKAMPREISGPVQIATFQPFSGPNADFGPEMIAGCYAAVRLINQAGGVLGHRLDCVGVDTSDSSGPVAAAKKMLAAPNLVAVLGPDTSDAPDGVPLIEKAGIPMFADTGDSAYNKTAYKFFWRMTPPDDDAGYAMALHAFKKGFRRGAAVFGDDPGAQANLPGLVNGFKKLGGEMVANEKLAPGSSYESQVGRVVQANPDVIFTETDPAVAAAFFSQVLKQRSSIAIIGTQPTLQPEWLKAVSTAIGSQTLAISFSAVQPYAPPHGRAWDVYNAALLDSASTVPNPDQWSSDPYSITSYDAVIITALAMVAAKTTDPVFFNAYIRKVTAVQSGAVIVHSYQDGLDALRTGHTIQYVGASGAIAFDQWHNSSIGFTVAGYQSGGQTRLLDSISAEAIDNLRRGA